MQVDLKKLKPLGIILILGCSVLALITCFTADMGVPPRYESEHEPEYYRQSEETMQELVSELEENVFPNIEGILSYGIDAEDRKIDIVTDPDYTAKVRLVLERDFGTELFTVS
ncbi:MAG: hypothetical protein IJ017_03030 [Oscillospiraceae bacterium]|nr:hypothetical protein [Oscillospiraceae bacterium]